MIADSQQPLLVPFGLSVALSFLIGLGLREYYMQQEHKGHFGSVRTYVFIGMLGFVLFQLPQKDIAYSVGFGALALLLYAYYQNRLAQGSPGLIGVLTALLTYLIGPLAVTTPPWFLILFTVSILFVLNAKERIQTLSERISQGEVVTLATFLTLAGVILPLLPHEQIALLIPVTPHQVWLAVVISTGISYLSYVLQAFVFPQRGLFLTGLLGGLYSSTATTLIIARKTGALKGYDRQATGAIIVATAMMYLRLIVVVFIFDMQVAAQLAALFLVLAAVSAGVAYYLSRANGTQRDAAVDIRAQRNPLELNSAAIFALLFVAMATVTKLALEHASVSGLRGLSFAVGFYDIDPYVVSLLQSSLSLQPRGIAEAIIIATASNNLLKALYAAIFARRATALPAGITLVLLAAASMAYALVLL